MGQPPSFSPIDPGGPVDPALPPQPVDEVTRPAAFTLMAPGWYPTDGDISQSYGFCFTAEGQVVLVQASDGFWNLPGGQLEAGETGPDALVREVAEEACARVTAYRYLACQHVWDPQAPDGRTSHYQTRWWARVELEAWEPRHETIQRLAVPPERVLATLSWRAKAIAGRLLAAAVACERQVGVPRQATFARFTASQGRRWQGRRPKDSTSEFEAEDAASGVIWPA